jgi:hypothetical protein
MKAYSIALAASAAALVTFAAARPAHALGPVDLEIAAKAGYGSNDLAVGLGGRAGFSSLGFYGGVSVVDYLGKSVPAFTLLAAATETIHSFLFGGEVGWGWKISMVTLRPLVGFGDAIFTSLGTSSLPGSFYVEPGGLVQLNFGLLIVGVDAGCLILTNGLNASTGAHAVTEAFTIHGQVGVKF